MNFPLGVAKAVVSNDLIVLGVSPRTVCRAVDVKESCQCSASASLRISLQFTHAFAFARFICLWAHSQFVPSSLSTSAWLSVVLTNHLSHGCCKLPQACSASTDRYINMLLFKESLTPHRLWPHSLQCLEKTAFDLCPAVECLRSAERTIRGRVARWMGEGGNVETDNKTGMMGGIWQQCTMNYNCTLCQRDTPLGLFNACVCSSIFTVIIN